MPYKLKDAAMKGTRILPSAASTTVDGAALDLKKRTRDDFVADCEFLLSVPALNTTILPDTRTMSHSIIHSDNADLSAPTVLMSNVIVQTGAASAGAAADTYRFRLPTNVKRYIGVRVVSGASTTTAVAVSDTLEMLA